MATPRSVIRRRPRIVVVVGFAIPFQT